jgi:hypothetical protein
MDEFNVVLLTVHTARGEFTFHDCKTYLDDTIIGVVERKNPEKTIAIPLHNIEYYVAEEALDSPE